MPRVAKPPPPSSGDPVAQIVDSAQRGKLVAVVGTGFSIAVSERTLPALGWQELIRSGLADCVRHGKITATQRRRYDTQTKSKDIEELVGAAEFMGRKLDAPHGELYVRWFRETLGPATATHAQTIEAFSRIAAADVPICTLNYDHLLERVTDLPTITLADRLRVAEFLRREHRGILHLHGSYERPETCILGIRDYASTVGDDVRDLLQRSLSAFSRLLFIGCGATFSDPNFRALIQWLRKHLGADIPRHYTLVRESEVAAVAADPNCHGFVEPLAYGRDYSDLPQFLERLFPTNRRTTRPSTTRTAPSTAVYDDLLGAYRKFLLREGEMTIEGMRADADTARRRFDIEQLFVPLRLTAADPPRREDPEVSTRPPQPRPFAAVFGQHRRLALLALPGGGKTMLLKRLAVAYADPERRGRSSDELPDIDLLPVLIRCRDWRDHIDRPLLALFDGIAALTGRQELQGLGEALRPRLEQGAVLLLVDGLDEIHDDVRRSMFVRHLCDFLVEFKRVRVVITSREAGFDLVASDVAAACQRFRIAPLDEPAIDLLARHWHKVMTDDSPQSQAEAGRVVETIRQSEALSRLAENPLLLTMLLVVKHGSSGRLPLDRLTLYERAVDVLLNTWNTHGHAPLGSRETIPTLAYVARQMLLRGKQTATESELLELIQSARDVVPSILRYATDTPLQFLRNVELRSSLLLVGGMQVEQGRAVPFHQFRHLTFQEYLAAVAVHEGYYRGYQLEDTILTPLSPHLLADDWKEVVPMAAALAKRRAQPLIAELIARASFLRAEVERGNFGIEDWSDIPRVLPPPVTRLLRCLVEGAEAELQTVADALRTISFFASGALLVHDFTALCRGPYGEELLRQALNMSVTMRWPEITKMHFTCARISVARAERDHWLCAAGLDQIATLLRAQDGEDVARGLYIVAGLLWGAGLTVRTKDEHMSARNLLPLDLIERGLLNLDPRLALPAVFSWRLASPPLVADDPATYTAPQILDKLIRLWLDAEHGALLSESAVALFVRLGHPRDYWRPNIDPAEIEKVRQRLDNIDLSTSVSKGAAVMIAFHAKIVSDTDLARMIADEFGRRPSSQANAAAALRQLGPFGQRIALSLPEITRPRKPTRNS